VNADGEQAVIVEALGRRWRFAAEAGPLLRALITGEEFGLRQLATAGGLEVERVRALLRELAAEGVVVVW
jgi:hypothetical protein